MKQKKITRGDIYFANLNPVIGSEQGGFRPVLVCQNNTGNAHSPTIVIVPITRNLNKNPLPTHVVIPQSCGFDADCLALAEQIRTIDRSRLNKYIGHINGDVQQQIDTALSVCIGIEEKRSPKGEMLTLCLCHRCENDFHDSGYILVKRGWQDVKEECDFCKTGRGLTFGVFNTVLSSQ